MSKLAEALVFTGVATALHATAFVGLVGNSGLPEGAGAGGDAVVTLAAAAPSLARRVEEWGQAPAVHDTAVKPVAPRTSATPERPAGEAPPARATAPRPVTTPAPDAESPVPVVRRPDPPLLADTIERPATGHAADGPSTGAALRDVEARQEAAVENGSRPRAPAPPVRPEAPAAADPPASVTSSPAAPPSVAQRAAGGGEKGARGTAGPSETATDKSADSAALVAEWSARVRERISRRKAAPSGKWDPGGALLRITLSRDGTLLRLGILRSSGDRNLDAAAVSAIRRARPFPAAPNGFSDAQVTFDVPVSFTR